ncbi:MAG: adenosylcobinamide-GDP ribazoletransferase [Actinomycetota bacterium]|nr:adenosylcobinamide-GDP ribazoletransferase [Actinomycetota bacterium]MDG2121100.1 adenosylcobinamide-GDP ribazoletransferase [Actinomycetota bacterium]
MRNFRAAVIFLTRVPITIGKKEMPELSRAVPWFPIVGALVGVLVGASYWFLSQIVPGTVAATASISLGVVVTGAFHLDGLADIADAFPGAATVERRLEILKDSRLGTYGTSALVLVLLLEIASLTNLSPLDGFKVAVAASSLGRASAVLVMLISRPAQVSGLGVSYVSDLIPWRAFIGILAGGILAFGLLGLSGLILILCCLPPALIIRGWSYRSIGGISGDSLGAVAQVSQMVVVLVSVGVLGSTCECG